MSRSPFLVTLKNGERHKLHAEDNVDALNTAWRKYGERHVARVAPDDAKAKPSTRKKGK